MGRNDSKEQRICKENEFTLEDGTKVDLMDVGGESGNDTYIQIENIDRIIMNIGVPKESSQDNIGLIHFDLPYVERIKKIISNR